MKAAFFVSFCFLHFLLQHCCDQSFQIQSIKEVKVGLLSNYSSFLFFSPSRERKVVVVVVEEEEVVLVVVVQMKAIWWSNGHMTRCL
jgi:hypothetical protein